MKLKLSLVMAAALCAGTAFADGHGKLSGDLKIFSDMSNPAPRAVMEGMVERFGAMHPDLNIELTVIDREAYKTQIRNFLTANPPDVANWYAGNRMAAVRRTLVCLRTSQTFGTARSAKTSPRPKGPMTQDGKQWGVPYTYYQWGVYYREDIYERVRPVRAEGLGDVQVELPGDPRQRREVLHDRHQVPLDRRRLVRLSQHAHQRLRLST